MIQGSSEAFRTLMYRLFHNEDSLVSVSSDPCVCLQHCQPRVEGLLSGEEQRGGVPRHQVEEACRISLDSRAIRPTGVEPGVSWEKSCLAHWLTTSFFFMTCSMTFFRGRTSPARLRPKAEFQGTALPRLHAMRSARTLETIWAASSSMRAFLSSPRLCTALRGQLDASAACPYCPR